MVLESWSKGTRKSYNSYLSRWGEFCAANSIGPTKATTEEGLNFLMGLYNMGEKHGYLANVRSALSAVLPHVEGVPFGKVEVVRRFMKGVFRNRPTLPRHVVVYDADIILRFIKGLGDNEKLDLEILTNTKKLCTLLCLLSGQRAQAIPALTLDMCYRNPEGTEYVLYIDRIMKTSKPGHHVKPIELIAFPEQELCIVNCLDEYINRTTSLRCQQQLIISYKSFKAVEKATIARYVLHILQLSGIDITVFTCHSTRAASTSKANNNGLSFKDIARAAGWRSESVFQRFYNKPIRKTLGASVLGHA